ncbi:MAG: hypothetical protein ACXVZL_08525 [Gaiellaceae bacterium]
MSEPVGEIRYEGPMAVRPYKRGTYLGDDYLELLIERALRDRYRFGEGWKGFAVVSIVLYDEAPAGDDA